MSGRAEEIIRAVQAAGVVGAGGGGFPTHAKLKATVDTVIANGSECEPLLASDKYLLKGQAASVVEGVELAMDATGAGSGFIAVKGHHRDVVQALQTALAGHDRIRIHLLENYYPAGDEFLTVFDVTKRVIPEGGLPLHVGVLVGNVLTFSQVAAALHGKPVTERPLTIAGSVRRPVVVVAPIGTPYADLLPMAGGTCDPGDVLIDGGPMMGSLIDDPGLGIARTTSAILALPADHFIVRLKKTTCRADGAKVKSGLLPVSALYRVVPAPTPRPRAVSAPDHARTRLRPVRAQCAGHVRLPVQSMRGVRTPGL